MTSKPRQTRYVLGLIISTLLSVSAHAQNLDLSQQPIFLGTNAKANVLFLIDDSGSMDWEIVTGDAENGGRFTTNQPDGTNAQGAGNIKQRDDNNDGQADCRLQDGTFFGYMYGVEFESNARLYDDGLGDCNLADDEAWRFRNNDFNPLYYNPNQLYTPWAGVDKNGNTFADINPIEAYNDPYERADNIDLTEDNGDLAENGQGGYFGRLDSDRDGDGEPDGFRYYTWEDKDSDQKFDNGEETAHSVKNLPVTVAAGDPGFPNSQTNFANWFSYYRSRTLLAKNAYGKVIFNARNVRMGLVTINDNNNANTAIRDMDDEANKQLLLQRLYADFAPEGGTPLRSAMNECGRYLSCNSDNLFQRDGNSQDQCPALTVAEGGNCQQNFLVTMTDGYYNGVLGGGVGNTDGPSNGNTEWDGGAYADNYSNTLADIAMKFYENDIQPDLANDLIRIPGVDEAPHQHVVSYTVAFGVDGTLSASPETPTVPFAWPNPRPNVGDDNEAEKIDDLRHAAYNGRGLFLDSRDPSTLADSLESAISDIGDRTSAASAVALNSGSLSSDTGVYQARFDSGDWSGELLFLPVSDGTASSACPGVALGNLCASRWNAGNKLDALNWNTGRVMLTQNADTKTGVPFRWNSLTNGQQAFIKRNRTGGNNYGSYDGKRILDYLRGDRRLESNSIVRTRSSRLGDIINSTPFFVGAPSQDYELSGYTSFRNANANREDMVYVGSNDGMVHGFNAVTGVERLAYLPSKLLPEVNRTVFSNYNKNHRYFVDGSPVAGDARINGEWRSVLVGGYAGGGQGVYALDVTNPSAFSEQNAANIVLWEFSDTDDADLGNTYSQPSIVRLANGKWAALISSGYNNRLNNDDARGSGRGYVFLLYLDGPGSNNTWDLGTDYIKIQLPSASGNRDSPSGVATPTAVNIDEDIDTELIYAGDLKGNLWRVDVRAENPNQWGVSFDNKPLFTATDSLGRVQPITSQPEVGAHPEGLDRGLMVYFGTGRFLTQDDRDPNSAITQSFYAIWDENQASLAPDIGRNDLLEQRIIDEVAIIPNADDDDPDNDNIAIDCNLANPLADCFRVTTDIPITYVGQSEANANSGSRGWYMDLVVTGSGDNQGERQVSPPILREGRIVFTTLIPSNSVCESGGTGWVMELSARDGRRLLFSPFDTNRDGDINRADFARLGNDEIAKVAGRKSQVGIIPQPAILVIPNQIVEFNYLNGSDGTVDQFLGNSGGQIGRIRWRQLQ